MENCKISIIVPIYNSANSLEKCINSLISQTYSNLEIILINDGSSDDSIDICNYYQSLDSRVISINQKNMGVSKTRNNGINFATGDYLMFVDSDDYVDYKLCQYLIEASHNGKDDLIFCSYSRISGCNNNIERTIKYTGQKEIRNVFDLSGENFKFFYLNLYFNTPVCKLYKKDIIKKHCFDPSLNLGEDLLFNLEILQYCKSISFVNKSLYFYRVGQNNSLSSKAFLNRLEMVRKIFQISQFKLNEIFKGNYDQYLVNANYFIESCLSLKKILSINDLSDKEKLNLLSCFLHSQQMQELLSLKKSCWQYIPKSYKLFFILLEYNLSKTLLFITKVFNLIKF